MPQLDDIITGDVDSIFLADGGFAEDIKIFPRGNMDLDPDATRGIWDADALPGSNEAQGDGRTINTRTERSIRNSVVIEMSISEPIAAVQDDRSADVVQRVSNGELVSVKRILGTDDGMMSVLCIRKTIGNRSKGTVNG